MKTVPLVMFVDRERVVIGTAEVDEETFEVKAEITNPDVAEGLSISDHYSVGYENVRVPFEVCWVPPQAAMSAKDFEKLQVAGDALNVFKKRQ